MKLIFTLNLKELLHLNQSETVTSDEDNDKVDDTPRRSKRQRVAKSFGDDFIVYLVDDMPKTLPEAYASPNGEYWKDAVRS